MVEGIAKVLEKRCGKDTSRKVMTGRDQVGASKRDTALWVKSAMERMDGLLGSKERTAVMEECGRNCCDINKGVASTFMNRKAGCDSLDEFLEREAQKPVRGTKLSRKGNEIRFYYTPRSFGKGMRCYCQLVSALPASETMSPTYCMCSVGFVKSLWERLLDKPVRVSLVRSAITGSDECEFKIRF